MSVNEKIAMLAEVLDENESSLTLATELDSLPNWDSMAKLSLIVLFDDKIKKNLPPNQIETFKTVGDIITAME
jgi:acyl carrier protein